MHREFKFLGELTDEGIIRHDRDEVREALLDLEGAVFQLGGIVTMSSIRDEIAPGEYLTTGVVMIYDSFAPAREKAKPKTEAEPEPEAVETP